jgi:hypothetical protein
VSEFCGRYLSNTAGGGEADVSICSRSVPFKLGVRFDGLEATGTGAGGTAAVDAMEAKQETSGTNANPTLPLGTMGFSLGFTQLAC